MTNRKCQSCGGAQPTAEQIAALTMFAKDNGRFWKIELRNAWMTGDYNGSEVAGTLQQIRNTFGPSWLNRFRLNS